MKNPDRETVSRLKELPNIGKAMAKDLQLIGINHPKELIGKEAWVLYDTLCTTKGAKHDPCVLSMSLCQ